MLIPPLPITEDQRRKDDEHIRLLAIFHFVVGGLAIFGLAFLCLYYFIMNAVFSHPELWKSKDGSGPPVEIFKIFIWIYAFLGAFMVAAIIGNIASGIFLQRRKHRTFSLVIAGLNCMQIPIGTALGAATIVVLLRESVRLSYLDPGSESIRG